jgi:hypothetical protein
MRHLRKAVDAAYRPFWLAPLRPTSTCSDG